MKKSVIITIAIIYIASIVVVGFLGIAMRVSNPEAYISNIILKKDDSHRWATNKKIDNNIYDYYTEVMFDKDDPNANIIAMRFSYEFENPEYAKPEHSAKPLIFSKFDKNRDGAEVIYSDGAYLLKFYIPGEYKITFTANDAKKKSITVVINVTKDVSDIIGEI